MESYAKEITNISYIICHFPARSMKEQGFFSRISDAKLHVSKSLLSAEGIGER